MRNSPLGISPFILKISPGGKFFSSKLEIIAVSVDITSVCAKSLQWRINDALVNEIFAKKYKQDSHLCTQIDDLWENPRPFCRKKFLLKLKLI